MKQTNNENAANRISYVGNNYSIGEKKFKSKILNGLPKEWRELHQSGMIHIHDLDAYGQTYNCLTFDLKDFPYSDFKGLSNTHAIIHLFQYFEILIEEMGNEQSGGMAFANFENEVAEILSKITINLSGTDMSVLDASIREFIIFCNENHTRMGMTSYYVTLNIGLASNELARRIDEMLLDNFESLGDMVYKPNIVFKLKEGFNRYPYDKNYDLFKKSLLLTAKKMIPTYLLCDCEEDRNVDPYRLSIMGCRTRVVDDLYGSKGAIGRGNIDNISINLPRIALEIDKEYRNSSIDEKVSTFKKRWTDVAEKVKDILIDRYEMLNKHDKTDFPVNSKRNMWCVDFSKSKNLEEVFRHGTLSIGFIGLSEAMEVLSGEKYYANPENYILAYSIVKHMRDYCDFLRREYKLNFSLLATSGELISGRFTELDKKNYKPLVDIFSKGFYTNSFHVEVNSRLPAYKKLQIEGMFHPLCNGGSISYVELNEAPIGNAEGLSELVEVAIKAGVHYLGFNFPKDVCNDCHTSGVFDECPHCHGKNITRIRRVSGYLEILDGFTVGKKNEVKNREGN